MSDHFGKISIQEPASPAPPPPGRAPRTTPPATHWVPPKKKSQTGGKALLWILIIILFFTVYCVAGFVGVPYYISTVLPEKIYEKTGFIFQPGTVKFNPLNFTFSSENILLRPPNKNHPDFLKIKSIAGKLAPLSLLRNDLVSDNLTIEGLEVHVTREPDGSYIFSSLFRSSQHDNSAEMLDFSDLPFQFSLNNISVSKSKFIFSDLPLKKIHRIEDIQLALPTFSNFPFQAGNYIQPHFSATINGSLLELTGKASVGEQGDNKHATDLSCDIRSLDLPLYFGYLPFELPFDFAQGKADGQIGLTFSPNSPKGQKLAITFDLKIDDAAFSTHNKSVKITVPATNLIGTLHPVSKNIHLRTLSMRDPVISSFGKNFTDNLRNFFNADNDLTTSKVQTTAPPTVGIDLVIVDGGVLQLFDGKGSDKPDSSWNSIQFSLKNYTSAVHTRKGRKLGSFRLTADQAKASSTFSWQGEFAGPKSLDGSLSINNIHTSALFQTFDVKPFIGSQGLADLKGRFRLNLSGVPSSPTYRLTDTVISIQNFTLKHKKSTILAAPILTLSEFSTSDGKTDFGTISVDNGTLRLTRGQIPESFSLFSANKYQVHAINFNGKATLLANRKSGLEMYFPNVTLKAEELNLSEKTTNNLSIITQTENGGTLKAVGSVSLSPFKATLKTEFSRLQSNSVFSFFTNSPFLTNMNGSIEGKGSVTLPQIGFVGELNIDQVSVTKENKPVISWQKSTFNSINYSTRPFRLGIVSAEFESPGFSWVITADDNSPIENFTYFLQKNFPSPPSSFDIQEIMVKNGQILVEEQRMSPFWQGSITHLTGKITDIHSAKTSVKSQFQLSGKLDDSPFTVEGESDFFSKERNGSYSFSLTDFPIADFHDQLAPLFDIDTSKGTLSVKQNSQWEDDALHSSGTVVLTGMEPESQASESTLPLALLTGDENTFSLKFSTTQQEPVAGSMLFDNVIARFQKLIIKASVSPLLLAAGDFTDLIDGEFAEFKAGQAKMTEKGKHTVARYSALLAANPNIGLLISGHYDRNIDGSAMKMILETTESDRVAIENKKRYKEWQGQKNAYAKKLAQKREKLLREGKIAEQNIPPKFLQEFVPTQPQQITVSETMLKDLAEKRVGVIFHSFTNQSGLEPERITIVDQNQPLSTDDGRSRSVSFSITALK